MGYERSDVNVPLLVVTAVACLSFVVISVLVLDGYFVNYREQLLRQANDYESTQLNELRASEKEILTSYGIVDKDKGIYRIPIERAMSIVAEQAFRDRAGQSGRE